MSIRVAIVGAGPAGFYAADRLLRSDQDVRVELLDRLPTPWGLVRAGVAPDHPNIKAVTRVYEKTAALEGFHFHGNVEVGSQLTHADLIDHHHAVIYANGASRDRRLGIEGEDLPGVVGATDFVSWYNGHPDAAELHFDLSGKRAVVVGNGNVALDVARMLVLPRDELAITDTADYAIEAIANAGIEEVVVLGRRGPAQAAFTTPELRELGELTQADVIVDPAEAELDPGSAAWLEQAHATNRKNVEVGSQLTHADLIEHHHAVIYASGASRDRRLGIEGEDLPGVVGATDFVSWYNGHPDAADRHFDLSGKRAVVVGNGNVALDVARMLVLPRDELAVTDTADYAIEAIANAGIEEVVVLGRRGPAQAAFTTPELRELGELTQADVIVDPAEAELDPGSAAWLEQAHATN
ncbi:MAG TPA: FAD-dependent oxidoreductase, partial [Solirubrobacteraceae bacterium]|nr:FAD-dependent oxidoreductase [Solirubrobacteraceae bacterium]